MKVNLEKFEFKKFDFEHELSILYSSGTTGKPKCICHRSGGVLLQHLKEHQLHSEIKENDNVFYFTTCGWMMWNWLISALASKASIVLFEGFPMYKRDDLLIKLADEWLDGTQNPDDITFVVLEKNDSVDTPKKLTGEKSESVPKVAQA